MRIAVLVFLFSVSALAQDPSAISAAEAACGPQSINFDIKDDNTQHVLEQPEAGKALVYVIQDVGYATCIGGCITTRVAADGAWVGANHHNSYFSFSVDPGEHHLCARWQSHFARLFEVVGLAHFTAEAGRVYYFRTRLIGGQPGSANFFDIEPIDSDQGKLFIASIPLSISHPKK